MSEVVTICMISIAISMFFIAYGIIGDVNNHIQSVCNELRITNQRLLELGYEQEYIKEIVRKLDRIANTMENKGKDGETE